MIRNYIQHDTNALVQGDSLDREIVKTQRVIKPEPIQIEKPFIEKPQVVEPPKYANHQR